MVPVVDLNQKPLMPCSEKRAKLLMARKEATGFYKKGIFCIRLNREPSQRNYQDIAITVDPGSKREGFTVATKKKQVINIQSDTPSKAKEKVEFKRAMRRARRNRKTPYRTCRSNRKIGRLPPSTKARWDSKYRIIKLLSSIIPINKMAIEDITAETKRGAKKWNKSFSPLEVGKQYFYKKMVNYFKSENFVTVKGFQTSEKRKELGLKKTNKKLDDRWDAHLVDTFCIQQIAFNHVFMPFKGFYKFERIELYKRQLHVANPIKGGHRRPYGGTRSEGISRGTLVKHHKYGICYVGGNMDGNVSLHNYRTGSRLTQNAKPNDINILTTLKWRVNLCKGL